jgi:hypothetical protein
MTRLLGALRHRTLTLVVLPCFPVRILKFKPGRPGKVAIYDLPLTGQPAQARIHFLALDDFPDDLRQNIAKRQQAIIHAIKSDKHVAPALEHVTVFIAERDRDLPCVLIDSDVQHRWFSCWAVG